MKKSKRLISLMLAVILLLSCMSYTAFAAADSFTDVRSSSWYAPYVQYVYENGLMNGTSKTTFSPSVKMDRAMLVTVLYRMNGSKPVSGTVPFTDVKTNGYYYNALVWAVQNNIIKGTSATTFSPTMDISREMMVTIFFRYSQYLGYAVSKLSGLASYSDAGNISGYALTAFQWAVANGIITGKTATTLLPKGTAIRAECATIIKRFCEWTKDESNLIIPDTNTNTGTNNTDPNDPNHTHNYYMQYYTAPTCTQEGYDYKKCDCGEIQKIKIYNAYDHYYIITSEKDGRLVYSCNRCEDSYEEDILTRYEAALAAPVVERAHAGEYSLTVNCYADFEKDSGYGYQCMIAFDSAFTEGLKETKTDEQWNNLGYAKLSCYVYTRPGYYYYKVRAYKEENGVFVYGPWSEVGQMERMNFETKRDGQAKYTYDLYFVDNIGIDVYSRTTKAIYIKTENPELSSIRLTANGENALGNIQMWGGGQYYDDVDYLSISDYDETLHKVEGGYLGMLSIDTAGKTTVEVREATSAGYVTVKSFDLNVLDYDAERDRWIDDVIADVTDDSMTPLEKMDEIEKYLTHPQTQFKYLTNVGGTRVSLAAQPDGPWFVTKRWDSAISPAMLAVFANRIGGFEEVHNCYGDYVRGTDEWYTYHHQIYVVYNGVKKYYTVCPLTPTGDVGAIQKIDFSDTSGFNRIG